MRFLKPLIESTKSFPNDNVKSKANHNSILRDNNDDEKAILIIILIVSS